MSQREGTIAAFLQLAMALVYLLLGVVSSNAYGIIGDYIYEYSSLWPYAESISLFSLVILPLVMGVIGLVLFYGHWMSNEKSLIRSLIINYLGVLLVLPFFLPVVGSVHHLYLGELAGHGPERFLEQLHSYDNIWGILYYLIPISIILSIVLLIYLSTRYLAVTSTSHNAQHKETLNTLAEEWESSVPEDMPPTELGDYSFNNIRRRLKWDK
jgi:hypothetical protein